MNLHDIASARNALREEKRRLAEREKEINALIDEIDHQLFAYLDEQGIDRLSTGGVTLSISSEEVPRIVDWSELESYVRDSGNFQLFQRRVSATAYRELVAQGHQIAGTETATVRKINMRVV